MKNPSPAVCLSLAALALCASARADVVSYTNRPLSNVVAQLDQKYGIHIVLKGSLAAKAATPISLNVGVPDLTTTRLMVIAALANAANVDFQKGFVVSKITGDQAAPDVVIDTNGYVIFPSKTMPVREAIATVASTDAATVQIGADVTGDVTFTERTLRASQAAQEIARQTHTVWRAYYALTPANIMANSPHPFTAYLPTPPPPEKTAPPAATVSSATPGTTGTTDVPASGAPAGPTGTDVASAPYSYVPPMGYSQYPGGSYGNGYGPGPYGSAYSSPYGGFGYGGYPGAGYGGYSGGGFGYGGYPGGAVNILPSVGGYGPFGGYGPTVTVP